MPRHNSKNPEPPAATQKEATPELKRSPESPASYQKELSQQIEIRSEHNETGAPHHHKRGARHTSLQERRHPWHN